MGKITTAYGDALSFSCRLFMWAVAAWSLWSASEGVAFAQRYNSENQWGSTFYFRDYWSGFGNTGLSVYYPYAVRPNITPWTTDDPHWWDAVVQRAQYAGFRWLAANAWGSGSGADPAHLGPLVTAIRNNGDHMKIALFDATISEVARKNQAKHSCYCAPTDPNDSGQDYLRFDLSDSSGTGEGGWFYFYDLQWKPFFETVSDSYRLKIDGRPVVIMSISAANQGWYTSPESFDSMLYTLKTVTFNDFGFTPYVIVEATWPNWTGSLTYADAVYSSFGLGSENDTRTLASSPDITMGMAIPGYWSPDQLAYRRGGELYRSNLSWLTAQNPDLVLIESIDNPEENVHVIETSEWGSTYVNITREYTLGEPPQPSDKPLSGILNANDEIDPNNELCSTTSRFCLAYTSDGDLVLRENEADILLLAEHNANPAGRAIMQGDGNFVVYDAEWNPVFDTGTGGHFDAAYFVVHSDGNLIVYGPNGDVRWSLH